jgi:hypothetical protein
VNKCEQGNLEIKPNQKDQVSINKFWMDRIDQVREKIPLTDFLVEFVKENSANYLKFIKWKREMKESKEMNDKYVDDL